MTDTKKPSYYLTTPIYYVNGVPHLGTAYTTIAADALARFERMDGRDVWYLTGLDEHGQKVAQEAEKAGLSPQDWVDSIAPKFLEVWELLKISNDDFIRTTEERHIKGVQRFFEKARENGYIYEDTYEGFYCVPDETFFTDEQLSDFAEKAYEEGKLAITDDGTKLCPDCNRPLIFFKEDNLFFRLSAFQDRLLAYYDANPEAICPEIRRNEVVSFVRGGLKDLSISRTAFNWGIPIPFAPGHVSYVWVDALLNYITAIGYGSDDPLMQQEFAKRWPAQVQFVGKDIIRFHCVIWPAMLMAADIEPPQKVFAHGFLLTKGEKMSKSKGNAMSPQELSRVFGVDGYRYYFLRDVQFGSDGSISLERMVQVYNSDLANSWGNLCSRAFNMTSKYFDGFVPGLSSDVAARLTGELSNPLAALVEGLYERYAAAMNAIDYSGALAKAMELCDRTNLYIEESAPWSLAKAAAAVAANAGAATAEATTVGAANTVVTTVEAANAVTTTVEAGESGGAKGASERLAFVMYNILESIRIATLLFAPVMPITSTEVWRRLGLDDITTVTDLEQSLTWGGLPSGNRVEIGEPLFPRLKEDEL